MFDALKFNVAMVTDEGFAKLHKTIHYDYAWKYENEPSDEKDEKNQSDDFMRALLTQTVVNDNEIEDYVPKYANPAIHFATDDMGSDEAMGGVLLDILIVIIAFILQLRSAIRSQKSHLQSEHCVRPAIRKGSWYAIICLCRLSLP